MSLYPEYDTEIRDRLLTKKTIKIGIFGSFGDSRKHFIESLKSFLRYNSYINTFDASDFSEKEFGHKDEKYESALENSDNLLNSSEIRICFLYFENDREHGINESAAIEIGFLFKSDYEDGVILIIEDGAKEQMHANLKGILAKGKKKNWITIPFDPESLTHEGIAESACYNYIGRMLQKQGRSSFSNRTL